MAAPTSASGSFLSSIASWEWWIGVVVVGIVLHLVASYLKPGLDRTFRAINKGVTNHSERRRAQKKRLVFLMIEDPEAREWAFADEMRCRIRATIYVILATATIILVGLRRPPDLDTIHGLFLTVAARAFPALCGLLALGEWLRAMDLTELLRQAHIVLSARRLARLSAAEQEDAPVEPPAAS